MFRLNFTDSSVSFCKTEWEKLKETDCEDHNNPTNRNCKEVFVDHCGNICRSKIFGSLCDEKSNLILSHI